MTGIGLVGAGKWGGNWLRTLAGLPDVQLRWCCDLNESLLSKVRQQYLHVSTTTAFDDLLRDPATEGVVLATIAPTHFPLARKALAAGKHVLVEKSFAPSVAEAERAVAAAAEAGLLLMVSQNYRFFPAPRAVADLIAGGELGPVGAVAVDFRRHVGAGSPRHSALANPLLVDMAIHHFDLMRLILGQEPTLVSCHAWNPSWSPFVDDAAAAATVAFAEGAVASWRGSWVSPGPQTPWAGEWRVECAGGEIVWTSRDNRGGVAVDRVTVRPVDGKERRLELPEVRPHGRAGALAAFAAAVRAGTEPETSGRDNLGSLALTEAAVASAATGRTVPVPPSR
jgi:predicted dehydrogenase